MVTLFKNFLEFVDFEDCIKFIFIILKTPCTRRDRNSSCITQMKRGQSCNFIILFEACFLIK